MVVIDGILISSSYYDILVAFRIYLNSKGLNFFRDMKLGQENVMVTCPFHKDGQERKPSCGISLKDGTVHCFTCGTVRTFTEMLSYCLGYDDKGQKGKEWIIANTEGSLLDTRSLESDLTREKEAVKYVDEKELDSYRYYHPYMFQRKLTKEIIDKFDVGFDIPNNSITFPVRDKYGKTLFIARRRVDYKYFNYPSGAEKPLYGIYEMNKSSKSVIICESIFNCLTCYVYGKEAIALNGTGSKEQIEQIAKLNVRTIYLGLDNDEAGNKGCKRIFDKLKNSFIFYRLQFPMNKDINDLEKAEFDEIFNTAIKMY